MIYIKKAKDEEEALDALRNGIHDGDQDFHAAFIPCSNGSIKVRVRFKYSGIEQAFCAGVQKKLKNTDGFYDVHLTPEQLCQKLTNHTFETITYEGTTFFPGNMNKEKLH